MSVDVDRARILYEEAISADDENRREAEIDLRFSALEGQWDERLKEQRRLENRPCFTFDRTGQIVRQIVGDVRLNPPSIKVRPQDDGADVELADTLTGLVRNIESVSCADAHYIRAADPQVRCGMGFLRVRYDYVDDASFDRDFRIEHVPSPFAAVWDPGAVMPTLEDANYWFISDLWTERAFKERWPKASLDGWESGTALNWREGDFVRVAEYWYKKPVQRRLLFLADGRTVDATEMDDGEIKRLAAFALSLNPQAVAGVLRERKADSHKVCMALMNGFEQLEPEFEWPGRYIPIAPVFGEQIRVGDRVVRRGVIRAARDAQIRYNVQATAITEALALAPKPKWLVTAKQIENYQNVWATAHLNNFAYLPFNPDPQAPQGPQRVQPEPPPAGLLADIQGAALDIEATTGVYRENLGRETNAVSGRAILSRQREGDVGTYLYADNLALAVAHIGKIIIDAVPRVYDQERAVRVLGEDGSSKFVVLNQRDPQTGRIINDVSAGRYDVTASVGPAFSTRREEARESIMAFMQAMPQAASMVADVFAKYQDWPGGDEIAKRFRKMAVAQGMADPEEGEPPPQPPPPDPNMVLAQAEVMKAQAAAQKAQAEAQIKGAEVQLDQARLMLEAEKVRLERQRLEVEAAEAGATLADKRRQTDLKEAALVQSAIQAAMADLREQQAQRDAGLRDIAQMMAEAARTMTARRVIKRDARGKAIGVEVG